ncbi:MAG: transglutaminase domain-containing protein [Niameybacter sp.]|uniref:transglutaminase domain-containing protein n=1 Tax=Niameybacter sp. TaxID=2033640 RepID=UPI002FCAEC8E
MLVSLQHQQAIEQRFEVVKEMAKGRAAALFSVLNTCTEEEAICLKYLYAYMPEHDLASYDGELFLQFVKQALAVRKMVPWGEKITGELFLNYVLQYRMNNENVEFYKDAFATELLPRVKEMNMHDATIETNYWCFEKATYQSTDIRTASPFTVLRNTYGRCGEESTLCTAALRSIGIPARQVYAPRWAHCDDNHAWTEAWIDGEWHFIGACEPEMRMDTGWFLLPASKGMLIHTRAFSTFVEDEPCVYQTEAISEVNVLDHYAEVKSITVKVVDEQGQALTDAKVRFELINYSELYPLADLMTNAQGEVSFITGLGDLMICAYKDGVHAYAKMDVRTMDTLEVVIPDAFENEVGPIDLTMVPAEGKVPVEEELSAEVKALHEAKHARALAIRGAFKETFYTGDKAVAFATTYAPFEKEVAEALEKSLGNYQEMMNFFQDAKTSDLLAQKVQLLGTLRKKDFTDITCDILLSHLEGAVAFKEDFQEDIFVNYVLAPRVASEMIEGYRPELLARLDNGQQASFKTNPEEAYNYVMANVKHGVETNYSLVYTRPVGLFDLQVGSDASRKVLFVAICRTLGVPAKYVSVTNTVAYYKEGEWVNLTGEVAAPVQTGTLKLVKANQEQAFDYYRNFTIAKLTEGVYTSLEYNHLSIEGESVTLSLEVGHYRILTTNRQADGTLHARMHYVDVQLGGESSLTIDVRHEEDTKKVVDITDEEVMTLEGETRLVSSLVEDGKPAIVAYLEVSGEPTEHLLNEMLEGVEKYKAAMPHILFILKDAKDINDPTLSKVLKVLPHIELYVRKDEVVLDGLYEAFEIHDKKLPLAYDMNAPMKAQYAWAGYNVGIGELLLKYLA